MAQKDMMDWTAPLPDFHFVLFDRTDPVQNVQRFYLVAWLPTLFEEGAVVRIFGRKSVSQRLYSTPFPSLAEAWPFIRSTIKTRLRHGYQITAMGTPVTHSVEPIYEGNSYQKNS